MKTTSQGMLALDYKQSVECSFKSIAPQKKLNIVATNCKQSLACSDGTKEAVTTSEVIKEAVVSKSELPEWQQANGVHIKHGHRAVTPSLISCVRSWFYLHNETVNIFSHLGGALLFFNLPFGMTVLGAIYPNMPLWDMIAIGVFLYGVGICFALSAAFHTFSSHSYSGYHLSRQLDFQGIIVLVMATSSPQVYYTFYNEPSLRKLYWSVIIAFGVFASLVTFAPFFKSAAGSPFRVAIFAGLGLATLAPIIHGLISHGYHGQSERFPLWTVALTHSFNILGATVYVLHFPERWWPGKFDIWGASHQIMHCAIVAAALTLLTGTMIAFDKANGPAQLPTLVNEGWSVSL